MPQEEDVDHTESPAGSEVWTAAREQEKWNDFARTVDEPSGIKAFFAKLFSHPRST